MNARCHNTLVILTPIVSIPKGHLIVLAEMALEEMVLIAKVDETSINSIFSLALVGN